MMLRMSCTAALLFLAVAGASAQSSGSQADQAPGAQESAEATKEEGGEKVCRATEVTGSRFKKRVCHTREQWREIELATERQMREFDRQPVGERQQ